MQIESTIKLGGIIICDIDEVEAECSEDGESHQIHISRPLTDAEWSELEALGLSFDCDGDGDYVDGEPSEDFRAWLNCGPLSDAVRAYLLALKA